VLAAVAVALGLVPERAEADTVERVVAVVNDDAIMLSELRRRAVPYLTRALADARSESERRSRTQELYSQLLEQLVDEELVEQTARKSNLTVTSLEIDQAIDNVREQNRLEPDQFWQAVRDQGFTEKQYRQDVRKQLLRLKVTNQKVRSRVSVTDESVREEYDDRLRQARRSQRFRAAHVFFAVPEGASATEVARALHGAETVRASLSPETFDAAVSAHGGGELGWLAQGALPAALEDALLGLAVGEVSEPVRGPAGIHIFLVRERQQGEKTFPAFDEVRARLQAELVDKAMQRQEKMFLTSLRKGAVIDIRL
jgi:peptidyl-prolyl cis-trans isomerase SurA